MIKFYETENKEVFKMDKSDAICFINRAANQYNKNSELYRYKDLLHKCRTYQYCNISFNDIDLFLLDVCKLRVTTNKRYKQYLKQVCGNFNL